MTNGSSKFGDRFIAFCWWVFLSEEGRPTVTGGLCSETPHWSRRIVWPFKELLHPKQIMFLHFLLNYIPLTSLWYLFTYLWLPIMACRILVPQSRTESQAHDDPIDGSLPGSPSLGFSRQEHWSGLPFPSPMHKSEKWKWSHLVMSTLSDPMDCSLPGSSIHGIFQAIVLEWGAIAFSRPMSFYTHT